MFRECYKTRLYIDWRGKRERDMERLKADFALFSISSDEMATCKAILEQEKTANLTLMPTHHISPNGDMMGFRYECGAYCSGDVIPVVRTMFFGHTAVECLDDDAAIMRLMSDTEGNQARMREFIGIIKALNMPADLDCIPDNATCLTHTGLMQATDLRSVDSKPWKPEPPESIGLYHAYIRGYNRDVRAHKLFIVCSGGCSKAADQFCNLVIDVGREWTAGEVAESEEAWWLRRACQRSRCRLVKMLADHFGVRVKSVEDVLAHPDSATDIDSCAAVLQAVPSTDTVEHDMTKRDGSFVTIHNSSVDTTKITNGILCQMHPAEGVWLFRGAPRGTGVHGAMFGNHVVCGSFPTRAPTVVATPLTGFKNASSTTSLHDGASVVRMSEGGKRMGEKHVCFDEAFFKNLERMQWNRDNGYVELIPIIVGIP